MDGANKIAVITGAGSGVGRAVAQLFVESGFRVALAGRRQDKLEQTRALAKAGPERALVLPTDVTQPAAVQSLFSETVRAFGRVDVLFNNAGIGSPPVPFADLSFEQWRAVIDCNLNGMFLCAQQAFRHMKDQVPRGGRIINNGSVSALSPRPNSAPYTASKHAISGLTKSLALDGRPFDIAAGQVDIGNAATELNQRMEAGVLQASGLTIPEPRIDVGHIARSVLHMATLPLEANVLFMTVMATKMPLVGRG